MEQVPAQEQSPFASKPAKLAIKAGVSVVALLMLRGIIGSLPMLKNSPAITESFLGDSLLSPLVISNAIIDTVILAVILTVGLRLAQLTRIHGQQFAELGSIMSQATLVVVLIFAYKIYELPAACFFIGRTDLMNLNTANVSPPSGSYGDFIRAWGQVISQLNPTAVQNASGESLGAYQRLALAVFRRPPDYYAWAFLILIAIPVIGLVPLVYRNLDTMADLLSHGAAALQVGAVQTRVPGPAGGASSTAPKNEPVAQVGQSAALPLGRIVDKLIKMKALLDAGAISATDFETQKQRVLNLPIEPDANIANPEDFMRMKALFDQGALTEAEYEGQKRRALQQI